MADIDPELLDLSKFPVIEIFGPTIQGEGVVCGVPTHFIRFGGCDYRCKQCDSMHAVDTLEIQKRAIHLTAEEIVRGIKALKSHIRMVTFSGGNPALWELGDLVDLLKENGYLVAMETQGTYWKEWILKCTVVTVSPKGPGMGEKFERDEFMKYVDNLADRSQRSQEHNFVVKIVCFDVRDLEFAAMIREIIPAPPIYLSIGNSWLPGAAITLTQHREALLNRYCELASEMLKDPRLLRMVLLPQLHTLAWGNKLGV